MLLGLFVPYAIRMCIMLWTCFKPMLPIFLIWNKKKANFFVYIGTQIYLVFKVLEKQNRQHKDVLF